MIGIILEATVEVHSLALSPNLRAPPTNSWTFKELEFHTADLQERFSFCLLKMS